MTPIEPQLLRINEVEMKTGMCRSNIYRLIQLGQFPRQVKLGARASAWVASEVNSWIAARIAARDGYKNRTDCSTGRGVAHLAFA